MIPFTNPTGAITTSLNDVWLVHRRRRRLDRRGSRRVRHWRACPRHGHWTRAYVDRRAGRQQRLQRYRRLNRGEQSPAQASPSEVPALTNPCMPSSNFTVPADFKTGDALRARRSALLISGTGLAAAYRRPSACAYLAAETNDAWDSPVSSDVFAKDATVEETGGASPGGAHASGRRH